MTCKREDTAKLVGPSQLAGCQLRDAEAELESKDFCMLGSDTKELMLTHEASVRHPGIAVATSTLYFAISIYCND